MSEKKKNKKPVDYAARYDREKLALAAKGPEAIKEHQRKMRGWVADYRKRNKKRLNKKQSWRWHNDELYRERQRHGAQIRRCIKDVTYRAPLQNVGCTPDEFRTYIDSLKEPWMTPYNFGRYDPNGPRTWQLDHITPLGSAKTLEELRALQNFKNIRPIDSRLNVSEKRK